MKKRRKLLVMLLAFSVFASSFVSSNAANTVATAGDSNDISSGVVTSITAGDIGPESGYKTTVKLNYAESSTEGGINIKGGNSINVTWTTQTDNSKVYMHGLVETLDCKINNKVVGTAAITTDCATITFNDNINNMDNVSGFLEFTLKGYNGKTGPNTSTTNIKSGTINKAVNITVPEAGTEPPFYSKLGGIQESGYVNWWLNVCDQGEKCASDVVIVDEIQEGQRLDQNSFVIAIGNAMTPTSVLKRLNLTEFITQSNATITTTENTINITIPNAFVKNKMIQIGYKTKITQKNRLIFYNNSSATYTLTGEGQINFPDNVGVENTSANAGITGTVKGELKILKVIKGTETPIEGVAFELKRTDGENINNANSLTMTTDKDGIANVKDLVEGEYSLKEIAAPEWVKFDATTATSDKFTIANTDTKGIYKMVENPIKTVDIKVNKKWWWCSSPNDTSATINLLADSKIVDSITKTGKSWEHTFTNMPEYDTKTGNKIAYNVTEDPIEGYESKVGFNNNKTVFNVHNIETENITVKKVWVGTPGDSATVKLFRLYMSHNDQIGIITLNGTNNWTHTFTVPTNFYGEYYRNYVIEDPIEGYTSERSWDRETGVTTFTNTKIGYTPDPDPKPLPPEPKPPLPSPNPNPNPNPNPIITPSIETVSIPVMKNWVGKVVSGADMRLLANGTEIQKITLNEVNQWKHIFTDLPKYDKITGREIVYTLLEVPVDGYNTVITGDSKNGFTVTNTIADKVSVGVTKQWVGKAKDSIIVNLFANGKKVESKVLNKESGWQHVFTNLPQYKDGKKIKYTISEDALTGYDVLITGDVESGFMIQNTEVIKSFNNHKDIDKDIENPRTGDLSNLFGYGLLLIISGVGVILVTRKKNRSKQ